MPKNNQSHIETKNNTEITREPRLHRIEKIFNEKIMIQEPMRSYPAFFNGEDVYSLNSLLYPVDFALVSRAGLGDNISLKGLIRYYQSINIGPKEVIQIASNENSILEKYLDGLNNLNIFKRRSLVISSQGEYSQKVFETMAAKFKYANTEDFKKVIGIGKYAPAAIQPSFNANNQIISGLVNDDIWLRQTIKTLLKLERISLDFLVIEDIHKASKKREEFEALLLKRGSVVVKTTGMAAGLGIKKVSSYKELENFLFKVVEEYGFESRFIITEDISAILKEERSMQIFVETNGVVNILGFTKNLVRDNANFGNMMSTNRSAPVNKINATDFEELQELANHISEIGYRGYVSFDLALTSEGMKIFEINGRMGGASPLIGVLPSLKRQYKRDVVVIINTIQIFKKSGVGTRLRKLRLSPNDIRRGVGGLIPTTEATLPQKISLIAVDFSEKACLKRLELAKKLL